MRNRQWLHFVGKQYYSIKQFVDEANTIGISRRVAVKVAKDMEFGDTVYLAQYTDRGCEVFGSFVITALNLDEGAYNAIKDRIKIIHTTDGGQTVQRGCGSYMIGNIVRVEMRLSELAALLEAEGIDASMLIGCNAKELKILQKPYPLLKNTPFRQGFRLFDGDEFIGDVQRQATKGSPLDKSILCRQGA